MDTKNLKSFLLTGLNKRSEAFDESLSEHDRKYHGGRFDAATMSCGKREKASRQDKEDVGVSGKGTKESGKATDGRLGKAVSLFRSWMPWCNVVEVDADADGTLSAPDDKDVRLLVKSNPTGAMRSVVNLYKKNNPISSNIFVDIAEGAPEEVAESIARYFNLDGGAVANLDLVISSVFFHCMESSKNNGAYTGRNGHDITREVASRVVEGLLRPKMILTPSPRSKESVRVICEILGKDYVVPVFFDSKLAHLSVLTMFPVDDYFVEKNFKPNYLLYLNTKRANEKTSVAASFAGLRQLAAAVGRRDRLVRPNILTENDFVEEDGHSIAKSRSRVHQALNGLEARFDELMRKGRVADAREVFWEYAKEKGWSRVKDEKTGKTHLQKGGHRKSDDIEYDGNGNWKPLSARLNEKIPVGSRKDYEAGRKTPYAQDFINYFRSEIKTKDGQVAGWYDRRTGDVALVKGVADAETVAHEVGWHAMYDWAERNHPELCRKLRAYAESAPDAVRRAVVRKYGSELDADALLDEIGAQRFTRDHMGKIDDAIERYESGVWWDEIEDAQGDVSSRFVKAHGRKLEKAEIDAIAALPPAEAVEALVNAMIGGKVSLPKNLSEIGARKENGDVGKRKREVGRG